MSSTIPPFSSGAPPGSPQDNLLTAMYNYVAGSPSSGASTSTSSATLTPGASTSSPVNMSSAAVSNPSLAQFDNSLANYISSVEASVSQNTGGILDEIKQTRQNMSAVYESIKIVIKASTDMIYQANKGVRDDYSHIFQMRKRLGGISLEELEDRNKILNNYSRQLIDDTEAIQKLALGMTDTATSVRGPDGESPLSMIYKTDAEALSDYYEMIEVLTETTPAVLNDLNAKSKEELLIFKKSLEVSDEQMRTLLSKQMAYTGEANSDVLGNIANVAVVMGEAVGTSAEDMKDDILNLTTNVNRFGNLGEIAAGKLAASLHSAGLEVSNLDTLIGKAETFEGSAEMAGNFAAMYGIQIDAMKATYLANEDQEEYFKYMRQQILESNQDIDNMAHARKKQLAKDLGMDIPQLMNFIKTGQQQVTEASLETAAAQAEGMDGVNTAVERFGDKFERAMATPEEQLAMMKRKIDVDLSESAIAFGNRMAEGYQTAFNKITIPESGKELVGSLYKTAESVADFSFENIVNPAIEGINQVIELVANAAQKGVQAMGGTVEGSVRQTELRTFDLIDANENLASQVSANSIVSSNINSQVQNLTTQVSSLGGSVSSLVAEMKSSTNTTSIYMNGNQIAQSINPWLEKNGVILTAELK